MPLPRAGAFRVRFGGRVRQASLNLIALWSGVRTVACQAANAGTENKLLPSLETCLPLPLCGV